MTDLSIVVPVYNSASSLPELVEKLALTLPTIAEHYELILVNDGSRDNSWSVIAQLAASCPWVHGVDLFRNYGQHNALLAGIRAARYPVTVTMDDDLQHPPDQIPLLLAKLDEGYDVAYGTPLHQQHGFWRDISSSLTKFIMRTTTGLRVASEGSPFRAFHTNLRDAFEAYASPSVAIDVLLTWGTTKLGSVKVRHDPRKRGKSNYSLLKLIILAIDMTTGFSTWPLRVASLIGFLVTMLAFLLFIFMLADYLITRGPLSLYRFITAMLGIFAGAQLFGLGIIGEYLARMHYRTMARPSYTVRQRTENIPETEVLANV